MLYMPKIKKSAIPKGEGKIFPAGAGHGVAIFHSENDEFSAFSTDCPHMHCNVNWRGQNKTWFCPCHGSQFDAQGKLMRGPSVKNLPKLEIKDLGGEIEINYDGREMHE